MKTASRFLAVLTVMSLMLFFVTGVMAEDKYPVPQTVKDWVSEGKYLKFEGLDIFVHSSGKGTGRWTWSAGCARLSRFVVGLSQCGAPSRQKDQDRCSRHDRLWPKRQAQNGDIQGQFFTDETG